MARPQCDTPLVSVAPWLAALTLIVLFVDMSKFSKNTFWGKKKSFCEGE
jgi:hypothetical protein